MQYKLQIDEMTIKNTIQTLLGSGILLLALATVGCSNRSEKRVAGGATSKPQIEATAPTTRWQEFQAKDGHFSISMPGKPQVSQDSDTTSYMVKDAKDGTIFAANMSSLSSESQADLRDEARVRKDLDEICDEFLKAQKGKELSREDITQDGWPGKTLKAEMAVDGTNRKMIIYYKFIYAHDKCLLFSFTGPSDMDYTAATDQFYHSLKIEPKS